MNCKLFFDLHKLVTVPSLFTISEEDFFFFLMGGYYNENLYDRKETSHYFSACKTEPNISLSTKYGNKFKKTQKLHLEFKITLDDLICTQYEKNSASFKKAKDALLSKIDEITALYDTYRISLLNNSNTVSFERAISRLFAFCMIENLPRLFASYKNMKLKPATINSTFGRDNDVKKLRNDLNQYHKIILYGDYGSGKTRFIKYCLDKWDTDDYCYINYNTDIETTLSLITYRDINGYKYSRTSYNSLFNENYSSSLLIIDDMYHSRDFDGELRFLADIKINVIIITRHAVCSGNIAGFHYYELPVLPDENIFEIFESDSGFSLSDEKQKSLLSELARGNLLLTSLIAYQCKKAIHSTNQQDIADKIDHILLTIKEMDTHIKDLSDNNIFKHPYDNNPVNLIGHIKNIYNAMRNNLPDSHDVLMKKLCCFGWSPIPLSFASTVILKPDDSDVMKKSSESEQDNLDAMKELSELGLLTLAKETVQLSPLICYAIFTSGISSDIYNPIAKNLSSFLRSYDITLDIPYLADILYTFFSTSYKEIKEQNNPGQKTTARNFNNWQELAYLIIAYYAQTGNSILAQKVCDLIQYPDHLKNAHNALDKVLFDIINKMQTASELDHMVSHIDKVLDELDSLSASIDSNSQDNLYLSAPIRMSDIILSSLDTAINQLYNMHLHQYDQSKNLIYEVLKRKYVINVLLQYIDPIRVIKHAHSSVERLSFYYICSLLEIHDLCIYDLEKALKSISTWENINYRIRGYAVIIFWQNVIAYRTEDGNFFINTILANLNTLKSLIHNCKLIPHITFRLCLYAYINTAIVQYVFIQHKILQKSDICQSLDHQTFYDLFHRSNATKEELDTFMSYEEFIFSSIENPA